MRDFFKNVDNVWPDDLPLIPQEPDHGAVFRNHTTPQPVFGESFFEPRHEAPRKPFRLSWWSLGLPLLIAALLVAYVAWEQQGTNLNARPADPTPSAQPQATRTIRVTAPAVTVQAAPRPAETVYKTATVVTTVTKTAEPKPAATVTVKVTATKTVTADPEPAPVVPDE